MQGSGFGWRRVRLALVSALAAAGVMAAALGASPAAQAASPIGPIPPLHTSGRFIVDALGRPVHLAAASWYGAESTDYVVGGLQSQPLDVIVRQIRQLGFNAIRLQWSNELLETNPVVPDYAVAANPGFRGARAMDVFDRVVYALTAQGIMVILDNHNSSAEWCCGNDGNDLWYTSRYPESSWIADWKAIVARYRWDPLVVGADLRNEPRVEATWGGPVATNWQAAAERGGDAVLSVNPDLLVIVEGVSYAGDLSKVGSLPVVLDVPQRVVYEAHDYAWYEGGFSGYDQWYQQVYPKWAYLITGPNPQPVWVGEFGTCDTAPTCVSSTSPSDNGFWFNILTTFLANYHVDWSYWPLNGTQSTGSGRTWNAPETYGVLNPQWKGIASTDLVQRLQQIER